MKLQDLANSPIGQSLLLSEGQDQGISISELLSTIKDSGVNFVLIGGHAMSAYTDKPRATQDLDIVVAMPDVNKLVKILISKFRGMRYRDFGTVVRFFTSPTFHESCVVLDIMRPNQSIIAAVLDNNVSTSVGGVFVRIPTLEMALAMKYAALVSPNRDQASKYQDATDFSRMCQKHPSMDWDEIIRLGNIAKSGEELKAFIETAQTGQPLPF